MGRVVLAVLSPGPSGHVGESGLGMEWGDTVKTSVDRGAERDKTTQIWNLSWSRDWSVILLRTLRHRDYSADEETEAQRSGLFGQWPCPC